MNKETNNIKIVDVIENQIPEFILEENENFAEFLKQYYVSQEYQGGVIDLAENLSSYKDLSTFNSENLIRSTKLTSDVSFFDDVINVESTKGWPKRYGLLKIDNEIITYTGITTTSFTGCSRGFLGVESLTDPNNPEFLVFSETELEEHKESTDVINLSNLFLIEFFKKIKSQFSPGFEEVEFHPDVNPTNFISKVRNFYQAKGTDEAYKVLFRLLFNENVSILKPKDFCLVPSDDKWVVVESILCELVEGDPSKIKGQTLYQDQTESGVISANGSIYDVDKVYLNNEEYYRVSIFSGYSQNLNPKGSIFGKFYTTPKTFLVEDAPLGQNYIFVDSTVGFPKTGKLVINDLEVTYTDTTVNQFLNCSGIIETIPRKSKVFGDNFVYSYEDGNVSNLVKLRVCNVLSGINTTNALNSIENDLIKVENLGNIDKDVFSNSLIYNYPVSIYSGEIKEFLLDDDAVGIALTTGIVRTRFDHNLRDGDFVDLYNYNTNQILKSSVKVGVSTGLTKQFLINTSGLSNFIGQKVVSRRFLVKTASTQYSEINNKYTANIQNAYSDDNYNYITSNGLPNYNTNPYKREFNFTTQVQLGNSPDYETLLGIHNFYDGELVTIKDYTIVGEFDNIVGIETGVSLVVKKIDQGQIKLSYSKSNVGLSSFINFSELVNPGISTAIKGYASSFTLIDSDLYGSNFVSSKTFKKIPKNVQIGKKSEDTKPGSVGILVNGVEIQNYKSHDKIYYGEIESINVLNGGINYDITNPPRFLVNSGIDTITTLIPQLTGSLKELVVTNPGFDYIDNPIVTVLGGGNNESVRTEVKTKLSNRELSFSAESVGGNVSTLEDTFIFDNNHGLNTGEGVIYQSFNFLPIGIGTLTSDGYLVNNEVYYVINVGAGKSFRLSNTRENSLIGEFLPVREFGTGTHRFVSLSKKKVIDKIEIIDLDNQFKYKKVFARSEDINHYDDIILIENHGFLQNDEIVYKFEGTALSGLNTTTNYYVEYLDNDRFKLKTSKTSTTFVNFGASNQTSIHFFEYSPIKVKISGILSSVGITTVGVAASITPVITGKIDEVKVLRSRTDYGTDDILNYKNPPNITELVGSEANLFPLVFNGRIVKVVIKNKGKNYFNSIRLVVEGSGYGAYLEPVIQNGQITSVSIVNPGVGYSNDTNIKIVPLGRDLKVSANLKVWNLNQIIKFGTQNISNGALLGKKYSSLGNVFGFFTLNTNYLNQFSIPRLVGNNAPTSHSPIIGWAYDGCPIYGPDGYANPDGTGGFKRLRSSYAFSKKGPSSFQFIEDYEYINGLGDLDDHNGRYCITPEFPKGVYAYFCTLDSNRNPVFPYFIGNSYKFIPTKENFDKKVNQTVDLNKLNLVKYTIPCGVEDKDNYYEYFDFNSKQYKPDVIVKNTSRGKISNIEVFNGGTSYKIKDSIIFDNTNSGGSGAAAEVSELVGVGVSSLLSQDTTFNNVNFYSEFGNIIGLTTEPHSLKNSSYITIQNISNQDYEELNKTFRINVPSVVTELNSEIPSFFTTGLTTSISIKGSIFEYDVDDLIEIENETLRIIGIDVLNNKLNVLREVLSTSHPLSSEVTLLPKKFTINDSVDINLNIKNESYYFNPDQSVAIGTDRSAGSGSIKTIYPLGFGVSVTKFIPNGGIFLPGNKFKAGDKVKYTPDQNSIQVFQVGNLSSISDLYIAKLDDSVVGLVTQRNLVNKRESILLFDQNIDNIATHKFETDLSVVTGEVFSNETVVTTTKDHDLEIDDIVQLNIVSGITTTYNVSYNSSTAKLRINNLNNPKLEIYTNSTVIFTGLSSGTMSATTFKLYTDQDYQNEYLGNSESGLEVFKTANTLRLVVSKNTPKILYYNIESESKLVYSDESVNRFNTILIKDSLYNLPLPLTEKTSRTFTLNYPIPTERNSYNTSTASNLSYVIKQSSEATGPISKVKVTSRGNNYKKIPKIKGVSGNGSNCDLLINSDNIGKILESNVIDNRLIVPTDKTLRPFTNLYSSVFLYNNYKVNSIDILSTGRNYLNPPIINLYNRDKDRISQEFSALGEIRNGSLSNIQIVNQGSGLASDDNEIVFTQNSNGIRILGLSYDSVNKLATITLKTPVTDNVVGFSTNNPLPFKVGDTIFVEGIISLNQSKFNSKDYNYNYFDVISVDPAFGSEDAATIVYSVDTVLPVFGENSFASSFVVNSKDIPVVKVNLSENVFSSNESLNGKKIQSNVNNDPLTNLIKIENSNGLKINDLAIGNLSNSKGTIAKIDTYETILESNSSISRNLGWKKSQGNLSNITQKLPDNDYYQNFSYSLKSKRQFIDWNSIISDLSHVSGYKKFGDLVIESSAGITSITSSESSAVNITLETYVDKNSISDFDLVLENVDDYDGAYSDKITFNSKVLTDNILSLENVVLPLDDISNLFDTDLSPVVEIQIDEISGTVNGNIVSKYIFFIQSSNSFLGELVFPLFFELLITRNGNDITLTSYSYFDTNEIGKITAEVDPENSNVINVFFVPRNNFNTLVFRAVREDVKSTPGISTISYGYNRNVAITTSYAGEGSPTSKTIYSIPISECSSGTFFVGISSSPDRIQSSFEASFLYQNGIVQTNVYTENNYSGLGTVGVSTNGSNIIVSYLGIPGIGVTVFGNFNFIDNSFDSPNEIIEQFTRKNSDLVTYTGGSQVAISTIPADYSASKYIIEVTKTVGLTTEKSLVGLDLVHYNQDSFLNNINYGIIGNSDDLNFQNEYDLSTNTYVLSYIPSQSATYSIKFFENNIYTLAE